MQLKTSFKPQFAAIFIAFFLSLFFGAGPASAQEAVSKFVEGVHYEAFKKPGRTSNKNKIEVLEFFWYGCGHCYSFEPVIQSWKAKIADDVHLKQVPAVFGGPHKIHAQAFYAAQALGALDKTHQATFDVMHKAGKRLGSEDKISKFYKGLGVDQAKFSEAFDSQGVKNRVQQALNSGVFYQIRGVPSLVVNGKYKVITRSVETQQEMLDIVDFLVAKERKARAATE